MSSTGFLLASHQCKFEYMRSAVDNGFDVNSLGLKGRNALHLAAIEGNLKAIDFLINDLAASQTKLDDKGRNAIQLAACNNQKQATTMFFEASDAFLDKAVDNAFLECARLGELGGIRTLAEADPNAHPFLSGEVHNGLHRVFYTAIECKHYGVIPVLLNTNQIPGGAQNLLELAIVSDDSFAVSLTLKEGASINDCRPQISSPQMCRHLIEHGFDINARRENSGSTAMHDLVECLQPMEPYDDFQRIFDVLLESGGDMKLKNSYNQTILCQILDNLAFFGYNPRNDDIRDIRLFEVLIGAGCPLDPYSEKNEHVQSALANLYRRRDRISNMMKEMKILPAEIWDISIGFLFINISSTDLPWGGVSSSLSAMAVESTI